MYLLNIYSFPNVHTLESTQADEQAQVRRKQFLQHYVTTNTQVVKHSILCMPLIIST